MAFNNTSSQLIITKRRELVASLRARGLTVREIADALSDPSKPNQYMVNPLTQLPFDYTTIHGDIKANQKLYIERAQADTGKLIADQLAEMQELRRAAWSGKKYDVVLKVLEREAKLLGLDAPTKFELDVRLIAIVKQIDEMARAKGLTDGAEGLLSDLFTAISTADSQQTVTVSTDAE